jgi:hypothetical protein
VRGLHLPDAPVAQPNGAVASSILADHRDIRASQPAKRADPIGGSKLSGLDDAFVENIAFKVAQCALAYPRDLLSVRVARHDVRVG